MQHKNKIKCSVSKKRSYEAYRGKPLSGEGRGRIGCSRAFATDNVTAKA